MLYPIITQTRSVLDLSGTWEFVLEGNQTIDSSKPLKNAYTISVPASFNDQLADARIRQHSGYFWYQKAFVLPQSLRQERQVLRFGSATHEAWVYLNGQEITHHKGGFTPFEVEINPYLTEGTNYLSVRLSNLLDHSTLPVGNYSQEVDEAGNVHHKVDENFDFFNYAGLHRPVKIYTTPQTYLSDLTITSQVAEDCQSASLSVASSVVGADYDKVVVEVLDEDQELVASGEGAQVELELADAHLWNPLAAYLYTVRVSLYQAGQLVDTYDESYGVRSVEVKNGKFLINHKSFYFKGFGKHEDTYGNGRGLNLVFNVLDIQLMKQIGANSFRTSHYPYSEEMMRLCDREGIVVIDETPAVGLMLSFTFDLSLLENKNYTDNTWKDLQTSEAHEQVIRELIARDKNHACVVMWSIANEAANYAEGAYEYFKPLFDLTRSLDPQKRPCTTVSIMMTNPTTDKTTELADVIALNRYYGWYVTTGNLEAAARDTRQELAEWQAKYPDKPIMYTEYGADTVAGFHSPYSEPFSEEFQEAYYQMNSEIFDEFSNFVGEQLWNFADFQTKFGINRVQGNKKGIFTRSREPKMVVRYLAKRWKSIPEYNYKP